MLTPYSFLLFCPKSKFSVQNSPSRRTHDLDLALFFPRFPDADCARARRISAGKIPHAIAAALTAEKRLGPSQTRVRTVNDEPMLSGGPISRKKQASERRTTWTSVRHLIARSISRKGAEARAKTSERPSAYAARFAAYSGTSLRAAVSVVSFAPLRLCVIQIRPTRSTS